MFKTIVFAYNGSVQAHDAFAEAIALAQQYQAQVYMLAVTTPAPALGLVEELPSNVVARDQQAIMKVLDEGVTNMRAAGVEATGHTRMDESPAEAIVGFAREVQADLIIVGHHPRGALQRWWYGSVGHELLDRLPCSLLVSMPRKDSR